MQHTEGVEAHTRVCSIQRGLKHTGGYAACRGGRSTQEGMQHTKGVEAHTRVCSIQRRLKHTGGYAAHRGS